MIMPVNICATSLSLSRNTAKNHHPVYFKKTSAAPFGNSSPQLRGAWICTWADLQNLQGRAAPPHQTETRWTEKEIFLCLSALLVKSPHFGRLLCWMGLAKYSRNYSGCHLTQETLIGRSSHHLDMERLIGRSAYLILEGQICLLLC